MDNNYIEVDHIKTSPKKNKVVGYAEKTCPKCNGTGHSLPMYSDDIPDVIFDKTKLTSGKTKTKSVSDKIMPSSFKHSSPGLWTPQNGHLFTCGRCGGSGKVHIFDDIII